MRAGWLIDLRPDSIPKAFAVNAIANGLICAMAIETRRFMPAANLFVHMISVILLSLVVYYALRWTVNMGDGMLASPRS